MEATSHVSPIKRWLESFLVWYILFIVLFLIFRFVFQSSWRFILFLNNVVPYLFAPVVVGLVISLLLRTRRLIGLYLLMSLIGILWVGVAISPPLAVPAESDRQIEVVSFNAFPGNDDLSTAIAWLDAREPAIIALQNLPDNATMLAALEDTHPHVEMQDSWSKTAIYSQFPILESENIDLPYSTAQRVVIDILEQPVVVYNVHLFMPLNDREAQWTILRYDENRRNEDIRALLELIENEQQMVIMTGDLNMTEWSPIYGEFTDVLTDAYRASSWGIGATWPAGASEDFGGSYPRLFRLDYVWFSDPIEAVSAIVGVPLGSDHLPLSVELIIP